MGGEPPNSVGVGWELRGLLRNLLLWAQGSLGEIRISKPLGEQVLVGLWQPKSPPLPLGARDWEIRPWAREGEWGMCPYSINDSSSSFLLPLTSGKKGRKSLWL